eukprot:SAG31_NODE_2361_length_5869_cov_3.154246_4_plen_121_part_00
MLIPKFRSWRRAGGDPRRRRAGTRDCAGACRSLQAPAGPLNNPVLSPDLALPARAQQGGSLNERSAGDSLALVERWLGAVARTAREAHLHAASAQRVTWLSAGRALVERWLGGGMARRSN